MNDNENNAEELYHKLGKFSSITMFDIDGNETVDIASAVLFQIDYANSSTDPKIVTVNLVDPENIELIFSKDIVADMDSNKKQNWYKFIDELRDFALTRFLGWKVHDITKARFDKNDFDFIRTNTGASDDLTLESKMYGSKRSSYAEGANKTRLIIRHTQPVQEDVQGSRSRNIKSIYIENAQGERFLMPVNHLPTARAMARHVANEGKLDDAIGNNIVEMFNEMTTLRKFNRSYRTSDNMMEGADDILEATKDQYRHIKLTLESLQKQRGYQAFVESFQEPALNEGDEEKDYTDLKEKLTRHTYNEEDDDLLPTVDKAYSDFENRKAARQTDDDAEATKNINSRNEAVLGLTSLTLKGSPSDDDRVRKQMNGMLAEFKTKRYGSKQEKTDAFTALKFQMLAVLKHAVLDRMDFKAHGDEVLNAVSALDFTHGKDSFMHRGIIVDPMDEKMGMHLYAIWKEPKNVRYVKQEAFQSESDQFESWANDMVEESKLNEYGEDEFEREKNPYEQVAAELEEYAYKVGNTDMDYEDIRQVADHLKNDEYDEAGRIVNQMDTEPREIVARSMADHDLYDVAEQWMEPMDDGEYEYNPNGGRMGMDQDEEDRKASGVSKDEWGPGERDAEALGEGSTPTVRHDPDPESPWYKLIVNHPRFHINGYSYFKEKGYDDEEIIKFWSRKSERSHGRDDWGMDELPKVGGPSKSVMRVGNESAEDDIKSKNAERKMWNKGMNKGAMDHMAKVNKGEAKKYPNRGKGKPIDKDKFFKEDESESFDYYESVQSLTKLAGIK